MWLGRVIWNFVESPKSSTVRGETEWGCGREGGLTETEKDRRKKTKTDRQTETDGDRERQGETERQ